MTFIPGQKYLIRYMVPPQRRPREAVLRYLGPTDLQRGTHQFDARPAAGTQVVHENWIISSQRVHPDTPAFVGRKLRSV